MFDLLRMCFLSFCIDSWAGFLMVVHLVILSWHFWIWLKFISGFFSFWLCAQDCYFWEGCWFSGVMLKSAFRIFATAFVFLCFPKFGALLCLLAGVDPIQRCWDSSFSKGSIRWKKHTQACSLFPPLPLGAISYSYHYLNCSPLVLQYYSVWDWGSSHFGCDKFQVLTSRSC